MGCIVIAMPRKEDALHIKELIISSGFWEDIFICSNGAEILQSVTKLDVSVVITTIKLKDMGYEELSDYLPAYVNMILLTKNASLVPFSSNIIKLLMPFKAQDLISTIRPLMPEEFYNKKKKPPQRSMEDQKVIDEAKRVLMERNDMTEPEAFRYLQKISMDAGRKLVETAEMFLYLNGRS